MTTERKRPFKPRKGPDSPRNQVAQIVRNMIVSGEVAPDGSPPSERLLSQQHGVHRDTVHRAFRQLEREGLLEKVARGWRVREQTGGVPPKTILRGAVMLVTAGELVYPPQHSQGGWSDNIAFGAIEEMRREGLDVLLVSREKFLEYPARQLLANRIGGLVLTDTDTQAKTVIPAVRACLEAGIPSVVYGNHPELAGIGRVYSDHRAGVEQILGWLAGQGCRRVLSILPDDDYYWTRARSEGYRRGVEKYGLQPLDIVRVPPVPATGTTDEEMARHLEANARHFLGYLADRLMTGDRADAILASSDGQIFPIARACSLLGLDPRRDVRICGYDNYWRECPEQRIFPCVPAATVDKLNAEMGRALGRMLLREMGGAARQRAEEEIVEPQLLVPDGND